jgi:hypothetical protein
MKVSVAVLHFKFGGRFGVSETGAEFSWRSTLLDFFINHKFAASRQKGFHTSRVPKNEEIGDIFVFSGSQTVLGLF